jgi:hypothetical protein
LTSTIRVGPYTSIQKALWRRQLNKLRKHLIKLRPELEH